MMKCKNCGSSCDWHELDGNYQCCCCDTAYAEDEFVDDYEPSTINEDVWANLNSHAGG